MKTDKMFCVHTIAFKIPSTLHRFQMKTVLFCSVFKTIRTHTNRFRIVFVLFSPVHTTTRIRIENALKPFILFISYSLPSFFLHYFPRDKLKLAHYAEVLKFDLEVLTSFDRVVFISFVPLPKEDKKLYDILFSS